MYLVAITRWSAERSLEQELPELAPAMRLPLYDARLRLSGPPPLVLATGLDLQAAQTLLGALRGRGHGAVACSTASIPSVDSASVVRRFELRRDALALIDQRGRPALAPYPEIMGLIRAAELTSEVASVEIVEKKLALGRAALTGGLLRSKQVKSEQTHESSERQDVIYLFRSTTAEPIVLKERELAYLGLGEARGSTVRESFAALLAALRRHAPQAIYDERLLAAKRRLDLAGVEAGAKRRVVTNSNGAANLLAAFLLMHAHVQAQV